jgi:predicted transcriptional regulator
MVSMIGDPMTYGAFMKRVREQLDILQRDLAKVLVEVPGCKQSGLSAMEQGAVIPNRVQEERIADALLMTAAERVEWTRLIKEAERLQMQRKSDAAKGASEAA